MISINTGVYKTYISDAVLALELNKITILGGSARSAALPFLVRLRSMLFKILCFSNIMAFLPLPIFPCACIGVAIFFSDKK